MTGNFDRPGGAMFTTPAVDLAGLARRLGESGKFDRWRSRVARPARVQRRVPRRRARRRDRDAGTRPDPRALDDRGKPRALEPERPPPRPRRSRSSISWPRSTSTSTRRRATRTSSCRPRRRSRTITIPLLEYSHGRAQHRPLRRARSSRWRPGARHDWQILADLMARIGRRRGRLARPRARRRAGARRRRSARARLLDLLLRVGPHRMTLEAICDAAPTASISARSSRGSAT